MAQCVFGADGEEECDEWPFLVCLSRNILGWYPG